MESSQAFESHTKKKSFLFKERDEIKRQDFLTQLESIPEEKRIWTDECGIEEEVERYYGRCARGERLHADRSGKTRHCRTTVIAAYRQKKLEAPFRFKGHTNTTVFNTWVQRCLVPLLNPDDWVILDNGAFHKSPHAKKAIEDKGAHILFLPPYSPDLNDIEPQWASLKARIRKAKYKSDDFFNILDSVLIQM